MRIGSSPGTNGGGSPTLPLYIHVLFSLITQNIGAFKYFAWGPTTSKM